RPDDQRFEALCRHGDGQVVCPNGQRKINCAQSAAPRKSGVIFRRAAQQRQITPPVRLIVPFDMKTSILAIVNPAAGFGKCAKLLGPALDRLRASGAQFDVAETKRAGHGIEITRNAYRNGYRRFIAVGGDGTAFEIVNGLFPEAAVNRAKDFEKPMLGFLPLGTGNSFLRDFTKDGVEYATRAIIEGRSRPCDVIRLKHKQGEVFYINILSLGFVADVATLANRRFKRLGAASYVLAVVLCLANFKKRVYKMKLDSAEDHDPPNTALLIFNNSKF